LCSGPQVVTSLPAGSIARFSVASLLAIKISNARAALATRSSQRGLTSMFLLGPLFRCGGVVRCFSRRFVGMVEGPVQRPWADRDGSATPRPPPIGGLLLRSLAHGCCAGRCWASLALPQVGRVPRRTGAPRGKCPQRSFAALSQNRTRSYRELRVSLSRGPSFQPRSRGVDRGRLPGRSWSPKWPSRR